MQTARTQLARVAGAVSKIAADAALCPSYRVVIAPAGPHMNRRGTKVRLSISLSQLGLFYAIRLRFVFARRGQEFRVGRQRGAVVTNDFDHHRHRHGEDYANDSPDPPPEHHREENDE